MIQAYESRLRPALCKDTFETCLVPQGAVVEAHHWSAEEPLQADMRSLTSQLGPW